MTLPGALPPSPAGAVVSCAFRSGPCRYLDSTASPLYSLQPLGAWQQTVWGCSPSAPKTTCLGGVGAQEHPRMGTGTHAGHSSVRTCADYRAELCLQTLRGWAPAGVRSTAADLGMLYRLSCFPASCQETSSHPTA